MPFYPDYPLPLSLTTPEFVLRPLTPQRAVIDYDAYMASPTTIRVHSAGQWQVDGYTLQENQRATQWHDDAHRGRESFAFVVLPPDEQVSLGCVYFNPLLPPLTNVADRIPLGIDAQTAMVTFWVREGEEAWLSLPLVTATEAWVRQAWRFPTHYWRVNDKETASVRALEAAGMEVQFRVATKGGTHYEFYQ